MITLRKYKLFTTFLLMFIFSLHFLYIFHNSYLSVTDNQTKLYFKNSAEYFINPQIAKSVKVFVCIYLIKKVPIYYTIYWPDHRLELNSDLNKSENYLSLSGYSLLKIIGVLRI